MAEQGLMRLVVGAARAAVGIAFAVLCAAVLIQVLGRSVFQTSPVWTEELTRFSLLFLAAFGVGLAYRSGDLVNVDVVCEALPGRIAWFLRLVSAAATALLAAVLLWPAWRYTAIGTRQTSPALGWRMDFVHASVLILLASLVIFAAWRVYRMIRGESDGRPLAAEER